MALTIITTPFIDGDYSTPIEVEGSPIITSDEITKSLVITRSYVVLSKNYQSLPTTAAYIQTQIDYQFPTAILITESVTQVEGPLTRFQRVYAQVPASRTEPRAVAWTAPGQSSFQTSSSGNVIAWDPYGKGKPYTRIYNGTMAYSYTINPPVTIPDLTRVTFQNVPVDYVGQVYKYSGNVQVSNPGGFTTEPTYSLQGFTTPFILSPVWVQEANPTRWKGQIWQLEVLTVDPYQFWNGAFP